MSARIELGDAMIHRQVLLVTSVVVLFYSISQAQIKLSPSEVFNRCYVKLFKSVVPRTEGLAKTLLTKVNNRELNGPQACAILIDQVEFVDNDQKRTAKHSAYPKLTDKENKQLIGNLHNFHNSWFSTKAFNIEGPVGRSTPMLRDIDEPSLYFTRALFGVSVPVSTVFTSQKTLRGMREVPGIATTRWQARSFAVTNEEIYGKDKGFLLSYGPLTALGTIPLQDDQVVAFGKLYGVEEVESIIVPQVLAVGISSVSTTMQTQIRDAVGSKLKNLDLYEHLGGGILGSQVFIFKNNNLQSPMIAAGSNNDPDAVIARRISSRVFQDLLCHQMPTLTEEDVRADVLSNSPHGFRLSASCMTCHTSLDPMAHTFRNFVFYRTSSNSEVSTAVTDAHRMFGTAVAGILKIPEVPGSGAFPLKKPTGALNYRDHVGRLIKKSVNNMDELGLELSKSDDFYRCIAKRYYNFFTGYDVNLSKINRPDSEMTEEAKFHRNKVYALGANLKSHKNISQLIKEIFNVEAFTYRQYVPPAK